MTFETPSHFTHEFQATTLGECREKAQDAWRKFVQDQTAELPADARLDISPGVVTSSMDGSVSHTTYDVTLHVVFFPKKLD